MMLLPAWPWPWEEDHHEVVETVQRRVRSRWVQGEFRCFRCDRKLGEVKYLVDNSACCKACMLRELGK